MSTTPDYKDSELFNTYLFNYAEVKDIAIPAEDRANRIEGKNLKYPIPLDKVPATFDPRTVDTIPKEDVKSWFYKNWDGANMEVISRPLDQAGCGSCWGFAAALMATEVTRLNVQRIYGDSACVKCPIFNLVFTCTGDATLKNGVPQLYATQIRNGLSPYYAIAFSPKTIDEAGKPILETACQDAVDKWKETLKKDVRPISLEDEFGNKFPICRGCKGNSLEYPLMLITNSGLPFYSTWPVHEWACFFGTDLERPAYCSAEYLTGKVVYALPQLYRADKYSHCTVLDFARGNHPVEVKSMIEWIKLSIYNYGPCIVGFQIFGSFRTFYGDPKNQGRVYSADVFIRDIRNDVGIQQLGGHAVTIVGWGETHIEDVNTNQSRPCKYWIVRNSWGSQWNGTGFFTIEQDIDQQLIAAGFRQRLQFEGEFGALYFNPAPTSMMTIQQNIAAATPGTNDMGDFLQPHPNAQCMGQGDFPEILAQMSKDCACRCGETWDDKTNSCQVQSRRAGASMKSSPLSGWMLLIIVLIAAAILLALVCRVWIPDAQIHPQPVRVQENLENLR